jgi:hypothetical protein
MYSHCDRCDSRSDRHCDRIELPDTCLSRPTALGCITVGWTAVAGSVTPMTAPQHDVGQAAAQGCRSCTEIRSCKAAVPVRWGSPCRMGRPMGRAMRQFEVRGTRSSTHVTPVTTASGLEI